MTSSAKEISDKWSFLPKRWLALLNLRLKFLSHSSRKVKFQNVSFLNRQFCVTMAPVQRWCVNLTLRKYHSNDALAVHGDGVLLNFYVSGFILWARAGFFEVQVTLIHDKRTKWDLYSAQSLPWLGKMKFSVLVFKSNLQSLTLRDSNPLPSTSSALSLIHLPRLLLRYISVKNIKL